MKPEIEAAVHEMRRYARRAQELLRALMPTN